GTEPGPYDQVAALGHLGRFPPERPARPRAAIVRVAYAEHAPAHAEPGIVGELGIAASQHDVVDVAVSGRDRNHRGCWRAAAGADHGDRRGRNAAGDEAAYMVAHAQDVLPIALPALLHRPHDETLLLEGTYVGRVVDRLRARRQVD